MSPTRVNLGGAVIASVALLLAGCGGGSSSPSVAHLSNSSRGSTANGARASSSAENGTSQQRSMVAYAQCMRSHGVPDFPEPTEGHLLIHNSDHNGHTTAVNPGSSQFRAAQKVCGKLLPNGGAPSPAQQAKAQESALKFSRCMRTHGVSDFPDPTFSGGGVRMTLKAGGAGGIDPNSPQFKSAQKTCQSNLRRPPGATTSGLGGEVSSSGGGPGQSSNEVIAP